jgi:hypothetical protein
MITDINLQHELLKNALEATDNYLGIEKKAKAAGAATNAMIHDFSYFMSIAHDALKSLGVLDQHEPYMEMHVEEMLKLHGHKDSTIADLPYAHVPKSSGEVEEAADMSIRKTFQQYLSEDSNISFSRSEIEQIVENTTWVDIIDLYDDNELVWDEDTLEEGITAQGRIKKKQAFARNKSKRGVALNIKLGRASSLGTLKKRATIAARRALYKRFLGNRDKSSLSAAEKEKLEQQVNSLKYLQATLATKLLPKMREIEQKRLSKRNAKSAPKNK